ncbi:MAG: Ig-like domain-containing protein [Propionibacteriaceae bacterium]|nr:Ig-like domain-containing protein [Propionibacteriaceae bacterium]
MAKAYYASEAINTDPGWPVSVAVAKEGQNPPVTKSVNLTFTNTEGPGILDIDKTAEYPNGQTRVKVGDRITYTYVLKNTSGSSTVYKATINEDFSGHGTAPVPGNCKSSSGASVSLPLATLAPLDYVTCTATYTVVQADVDSTGFGTVTNHGTATGSKCENGDTTGACAATTPDDDPNSGTTTTVDTVPPTVAQNQPTVGDQYVTGNVTDKNPATGVDEPLKNAPVVVTDSTGVVLCETTTDQSGNYSCAPNRALKEGEEITSTATDPAGNQGHDTDTVWPTEFFERNKTADKDIVSVGDVITYTYTVKNLSSALPVTNVTIVDTFDGHGTKPVPGNCVIMSTNASVSLPATIPAGQTLKCTATYTVVAADVDSTNHGTVTNKFTVTGGPTPPPAGYCDLHPNDPACKYTPPVTPNCEANPNDPACQQVVVDNTKPLVTINPTPKDLDTTVSGTVTDDGKPLADAPVEITDSQGNLLCETKTDASGNYTCGPTTRPLTAGEVITATATDPAGNEGHATATVVPRVPDSAKSTLEVDPKHTDVETVQTTPIHVKVTTKDADGVIVPNGAIDVTIPSDWTCTPALSGSNPHSITTNAQGVWETDCKTTRADTYEVKATNPADSGRNISGSPATVVVDPGPVCSTEGTTTLVKNPAGPQLNNGLSYYTLTLTAKDCWMNLVPDANVTWTPDSHLIATAPADTKTGTSGDAKGVAKAYYASTAINTDPGWEAKVSVAKEGQNPPVTKSAFLTFSDSEPAGILDVDKTASYPNGQTAVHVGDVITYTYKLSNTSGSTTVYGVTLSEQFTGHGTTPVPGNCKSSTNQSVTLPLASLAPNDYVTCTATYTVVQADVDSSGFGTVQNRGVAQGSKCAPPQTAADCPANTPTDDDGSGTNTTVDNVPPTVVLNDPKVGDEYVDGNVKDKDKDTGQLKPLPNAQVVITDESGAVLCTDTTDENGDFSCKPNRPLKEGEKITATATDPAGNAGKDDAIVQPDKWFEVTKSADKTIVTKGDVIRYTYTVKNLSSKLTVQNVTVSEVLSGTDAFTGKGTPPVPGHCTNVATGAAVALPATIAPQATITCWAEYTVVAADAPNGSGTISNAFVASGEIPPVGPNGEPTCQTDCTTGPSDPGKADVPVDTTAPEVDLDTPAGGDKIVTGTVTDDGKPLAGADVSVKDADGNELCTNHPKTDAKGEFTCETSRPLEPGEEITATATDPAGNVGEDRAIVGPKPEPKKILEVNKTADKSVVKVGDVITYTYKVKNISATETVNDVKVEEGAFSGKGVKPTITCPAKVLAPGAEMTCTATYTVVEADAPNGQGKILNAGVASGGIAGCVKAPCEAGNDTDNPNSKVEVPVDNTPPVIKVDQPTEGDTQITGEVTDQGKPLPDAPVTVTDANGNKLCETKTDAKGEFKCDSSRPLKEGEKITATTYDPAGNKGTDDAIVKPDKWTTVVKTSDKTVVKVGDTITYTFAVTNNSSKIPLVDVTITETEFTGKGTPPVIPAIPRIEPGQTVTVTATYVVVAADVDANGVGQIKNAAVANSNCDPKAEGCEPSDKPVPGNPGSTTTDVDNQPPVVTVDPAKAGDNQVTGNVTDGGKPLPNAPVTVTDAAGNNICKNEVKTDANGNFTCETTRPLVEGEKLTVTATDPAGNKGSADVVVGKNEGPGDCVLKATAIDFELKVNTEHNFAVKPSVTACTDSGELTLVSYEEPSLGTIAPAKADGTKLAVSLDPAAVTLTYTAGSKAGSDTTTVKVKDAKGRVIDVPVYIIVTADNASPGVVTSSSSGGTVKTGGDVLGTSPWTVGGLGLLAGIAVVCTVALTTRRKSQHS